MKSSLLLAAVASVLIIASSCKSKSQKEAEKYMSDVEKVMKENSPESANEKPTVATALPEEMKDILGEWELQGFIGDRNDNLLLDEDERRDLKTAGFKDYMRFNKDGTGEFTVARMEGRYEAKPEESGGKPYLTWYDSANGPHKIGTFLSVTKDELLIKEPGGNGLFLWKRV